jgi:hypothetical protein
LTWVEPMVVFYKGRGRAWWTCVCFVLVAPLAASDARCCAKELVGQHVTLRSAWQVSVERCPLPVCSSATK